MSDTLGFDKLVAMVREAFPHLNQPEAEAVAVFISTIDTIRQLRAAAKARAN